MMRNKNRAVEAKRTIVSAFLRYRYKKNRGRLWMPGRVVRERRRDGTTVVATYPGRWIARPVHRPSLTPRIVRPRYL